MLEQYLDALLFELQGADEFLMAMPAEERAAWDGLPGDVRQKLTGRADQWLQKDVPPLSASSFISFSRAGVAADYEASRRVRRDMLRDLVLGSCVAPDGRYDMKLADVVWAICEESSWLLPQNNPLSLGRKGLPLPDPYSHRVDAAAAETAADLALAAQMVSARLDAVSPQLFERIEREIDRRVTRPFLSLNDMAWMCGPKGDALRCLAGCAMAFLTFERNDRQRWQCMRKAWTLFDRLISAMPGDGSVPGGLDDWGAVAEPAMDMVMMVLSVSRGRVDVRREKQIQLLCHFPVFCHVAKDWFVNPGRHSMRPPLDGAQLFRLGDYIGDDALCELGVFLRRAREAQPPREQWLLHAAADLFNGPVMDREIGRAPFRRQGFFNVAQMMVARGEEDAQRGLALAAHGGNNGVIGSHPDAGDFVLFCGGEPVLVDAGFLEDTMFHNLPVIDGQGQSLGSSFGARDVTCRLEEDYAMLSMDLAAAYPPKAGARAWQRTLLFERDAGVVQLMELFELTSPRDIEFCFMTPVEPSLGQGWAQLGPVRMRWEKGLEARAEPFSVPEGPMRELWGETLYRLTLTTERPLSNGKLTFSFNPLRTFG
ncbi:MAG: hypothetical protein IKO07_03510 [Clostridia bacterium]|nr:hypothetical protein [Clostridia bacterium]